MADSIWPVNAVTGAPSYSGRMLRQTGAVAFAGATSARPLGARSGVRPGTSVTTVTATSTTWTCGPFAGAADVQAAAEAGPYSFAFDAVTSGSMQAAHASLTRIDIVYVQVDDPSESDGSTVPAVTRKYFAGAAGSGVAPALPVARAFVIAKINVPISGGGAPTVTWVAPYVVTAGGILPVDTLTNLNLVVGHPGQHATIYGDPANNGDYAWSGTTWVIVTGPFPVHRLTDARANVDGASQVPVFTSDPAHSTTTTLAAPHAQGITIAAVGTYAIKVDIIFAVAATGLSYVQIDGDSTTNFARAPMAVGHDRVSVSVPAYRVFGANQILPITFYKNNGNLGTNYVSVVVTKLTV
jgi:hypothetical protein